MTTPYELVQDLQYSNYIDYHDIRKLDKKMCISSFQS